MKSIRRGGQIFGAALNQLAQAGIHRSRLIQHGYKGLKNISWLRPYAGVNPLQGEVGPEHAAKIEEERQEGANMTGTVFLTMWCTRAGCLRREVARPAPRINQERLQIVHEVCHNVCWSVNAKIQAHDVVRPRAHLRLSEVCGVFACCLDVPGNYEAGGEGRSDEGRWATCELSSRVSMQCPTRPQSFWLKVHTGQLSPPATGPQPHAAWSNR